MLLLLVLLLTAPPSLFQYHLQLQEELRIPLPAPLFRAHINPHSRTCLRPMNEEDLPIESTNPTPSPPADTLGHYPTRGHRLFVAGDYWTTSTSGEVTFHSPRPITSAVPAVAPVSLPKQIPISCSGLLLLHPIDITPTKTDTPWVNNTSISYTSVDWLSRQH